jgi:hypothetical protein
VSERFPCVEDKKSTVGFDRHYVYHIGWAARVLARTKPLEHVDISSIVDFCSVISAFIPTRFYEFRPPDLKLDGLVVEPADLLALPFEDRSVHPSPVCMLRNTPDWAVTRPLDLKAT